MLIELCAGNYTIHDGLVNGVDGLFKSSIVMNSKTYIFIEFLNTKVGSLTCLVNAHLYKDKTIDSIWTPIEPQTKEIIIGKNQTHLITCIQFPIQLAADQTIQHSQGLSLNETEFDPKGANKNGLVYTALSRIRTKEKLYLLNTLAISNFQIDRLVSLEMERLTTSTKWNLLVLILKNIHQSHTIIQSIIINSLSKHYLNIQNDHNLQSSHILCFQETRIKCSQEIYMYINTSKYNYIHNSDRHGLLMLYEKNIICSSSIIKHHNGSEFIGATFNDRSRKAIT